jgi:cytoskeletal protein CcmA (bactofilin family)
MIKLGKGNAKTPVANSPANSTLAAPAPGHAVPASVTVIGENICIEGSILAEEDLFIEGSMKGGIIAKSHTVTVGMKGRVEADIHADTIVISGRTKGSLIGFSKVQITQSADFTGHIKAKSVAVEDGAFLKATIELDRELSDKTNVPSHHRIDAIVFPGETPGENIPIRELTKPNCHN